MGSAHTRHNRRKRHGLAMLATFMGSAHTRHNRRKGHIQTAGVYLFFFLFLFPFCRSLRFAPRPPKRVGGGRAARGLSPAAPTGCPLSATAPFGGSPLPLVAPPGRPPPNRSLRGVCGGSCRPHPPLLRSWLGARRTAPAGRRPSDTQPAASLLRSQAGARRTAPAGRCPSDTCLSAPFAPCVGCTNAPVGRDRAPDTLRTSHARHGLLP